MGHRVCLLLLLAGCALRAAGTSSLARTVTITRDEYGVPHIESRTDAGAVFGLLYAQAEDNFWQLEDDLVRATGRAAELYGERSLLPDILNRLFEVNRLAQLEYANASPRTRRLADAFAGGINHYLATHPHVRPRLLDRVEPWFVFAMERTLPVPALRANGARIEEFLVGNAPASPSEPDEPAAWAGSEPRDGSNMWAVAASRTASGRPMLLINPHVGFFGGGQRYEAHLRSREGLHVAGFAILGTPYIRSGHNERLAWSHTNNYSLAYSVFAERFDDPTRPLAYRHGQGYREATEWTDQVRVRTGAGVETRQVRLVKTHHGPVFARRNGRVLSMALAGLEDGEMEQRLAMAKSRTLTEFRAALSRRRLTGSNTLYADRDGNLFYLHGNAIPRRDPTLDWSRPVDGADPATGWQGYHELRDLPQLLNPASGWLQNCNSTPYLTSEEGNPKPDGYPAYMAPEPDTMRARSSRRILSGARDLTFDEFTRLATDTTVQRALEAVPGIVAAWESQGRPEALTGPVSLLRDWDRVSRIESVPMTLFVRWCEQVDRQPPAERGDAGVQLSALSAAVQAVERDHGSWQVPWGEVNRLQRVHTSGTVEPFRDDRPSLFVPGAPSPLGTIFTFAAGPADGQARRYGTAGNTFVSVVELGPQVRARSVVTFGQSADLASPHFLDQAPLYARGEFKQAWFTRGEVKAHARRTYRP